MVKKPTHVVAVAAAGFIFSSFSVAIYLLMRLDVDPFRQLVGEELFVFYASLPLTWSIAWPLYALSGLLGSLLLIFKRSWAPQPFLLSALSVILLSGWSYFDADLRPEFPAGHVVHSLTAIFVSIFLVLYSQRFIGRTRSTSPSAE